MSQHPPHRHTSEEPVCPTVLGGEGHSEGPRHGKRLPLTNLRDRGLSSANMGGGGARGITRCGRSKYDSESTFRALCMKQGCQRFKSRRPLDLIMTGRRKLSIGPTNWNQTPKICRTHICYWLIAWRKALAVKLIFPTAKMREGKTLWISMLSLCACLLEKHLARYALLPSLKRLSTYLPASLWETCQGPFPRVYFSLGIWVSLLASSHSKLSC